MIITRKKHEISSPSLRDALAGKLNQKNIDVENDEKQLDHSVDNQLLNKEFGKEELYEVWVKQIEKYVDQPHLYNTLQQKPELEDNWLVVIKVDNSVQQEKIRKLKPEILGYLRRTLQNSKIEVKVVIEQRERTKILTNDQRLKEMIKKNPLLALMKNKFNLDFNQ